MRTTAQSYDGLAEEYLAEKKAPWRLRFENPTIEKLIENIGFGSTVLDLGCGSGTHAEKMIRSRGAMVHGIDNSEDQVKLAKNFFKDSANATFSVADARTYRPGNGKLYDAVAGFLILASATSYSELRQFFDTIAKCLKNEGVFVGITVDPSTPIAVGSQYEKYGLKFEYETPRRNGSKMNVVHKCRLEEGFYSIVLYHYDRSAYISAAQEAGIELEFTGTVHQLFEDDDLGFWDLMVRYPLVVGMKGVKKHATSA